MAKARWFLGWVDAQGRISIGTKAKAFLGIKTKEFVWLMIEPTGKFDRGELDGFRGPEEEEE